MILGSIGEFLIGNTFPFVVFGTFGAFWLAFAATLVPWFNAYGAYVTDPTQAAAAMGNPGNAAGLQQPGFYASFAFFLVFMGLVCLIFLVCSVRTNVVFMVIFLTLVGAFACLAAAYWNLALVYENPDNVAAVARAGRLQIVSFFLPFPPAPSYFPLLSYPFLSFFFSRLRGGGAADKRCFSDSVCTHRPAAHSPSSPPWPAGGSSAPSCWPVWISRLVCRSGI